MSILADWFAGLPDEKFRAFDGAVKDLESSYGMLSVSLDEAFKLREQGSLIRAREYVGTTADLVNRLERLLVQALTALADYGRDNNRVPRVTSLDVAYFRGKNIRSEVLWESVLERALLARRWRFGRKLRALLNLVQELSGEFRHAAGEIAEGVSVDPGAHWETLDDAHYNLNTCLRETTIVLKSFLLDLPDAQFEAFQRRLLEPRQAGSAD